MNWDEVYTKDVNNLGIVYVEISDLKSIIVN